MSPSIAIVGCGPAGLTLARLLQLSPTKLDLTLYEGDASATSRDRQGGSLDLHTDTGLKALKAMNLMDAAAPFLRYEGEELVFADRNGCELIHIKTAVPVGERSSAPEIDREKLRDLLLEAVGPENVRWGKHLKRVDGDTGKLEFADGSVEGPFDLVVGADGAWSKVRHVLTDDRPRYSGICGIQAHIERPNEDYPEISKAVGRGSYFAFGGGRAMMSQRMSNEDIKVAFWMKRDASYLDELSSGDKIDEDTVKPKLKVEFKDWAPLYQERLRTCHLDTKWKLWELPVGSTWKHRAGFTMVGDAAHLCTPFAGLGVNAAMKDSLELAELIIDSVQKGSNSIDVAVEKYEIAMFPRAKRVQSDTMRNKTNGFADDAPINFLAGFAEMVGEQTGWPIDKGVLYYVPITKLFYAVFWTKVTLFATWMRMSSFFAPRKGKVS